MTQESLAEALGVSIQSVSKWEGDYNLPDISTIVPLAKILNVTTDCLLGMDINEEEEKIALLDKLNELDLLSPSDEEFANARFKHRELLKKYVEKYPLDFAMQFKYAESTADIFDNISRSLVQVDEEKYNEMFVDAEKTLKRIINQDKDTERQIKARRTLADLYTWTRKYADAERVALELPSIFGIREDAFMHISSCEDDFNRALGLAEKVAKIRADAYMSSLFYRARQTSVFGNVRKHEAIKKFEQMKRAALDYEEICDGKYPETMDGKRWVMVAVQQLANCHFAIGEVDKALSCVEEVTSLAEEYFDAAKKNERDPKKLERHAKVVRRSLICCYNWLFAKDDNAFTREERFKKCIERINALNL